MQAQADGEEELARLGEQLQATNEQKLSEASGSFEQQLAEAEAQARARLEEVEAEIAKTQRRTAKVQEAEAQLRAGLEEQVAAAQADAASAKKDAILAIANEERLAMD